MSVRPLLWLALVLLFVPALAACDGGGGGDAKTGVKATTVEAGNRLTQRPFVQAANPGCIESHRRVYALGSLSTHPAGWARTARAARRAVSEMRRLQPPAARQAGFDTLVQLGDDLATQIDTVRKALVAKNYNKARAAQVGATTLDTKIKRQAQTLGLTFCEQLLTNWPA